MTAAQSEAAAEPEAGATAPVRRTRGTRGGRGRSSQTEQSAAELAPEATADEAAIDTAVEAASPGRTRTRGGRGRGGRGRSSQSEPAAEEEVATPMAIEANASEEAAIEAAIEGTSPATPGRTRTRGGRGRGGRGRSEQNPAVLDAAIDAALESSSAAPTPGRTGSRSRGGRGRGGRGGDAPGYRSEGTGYRSQSPAPNGQRPPVAPRSSAPAGSVEGLIARQNVLFEEFANQQADLLRQVQRSVGNGMAGGSGGGTAVPKVGVFVDVPNLIYAAEQMGVRIHFGKLLDYLVGGRQLVRATAYAPVTDDPQTRFEAQRFVAPLINQGYKIVSKPWKRFSDGSMKANFDIQLAVDILTMSDRLDVVVLMSGDGDFRPVCELVESKGVRVEVVAFAVSTAMELRSVADSYTDLASILNIVGV